VTEVSFDCWKTTFNRLHTFQIFKDAEQGYTRHERGLHRHSMPDYGALECVAGASASCCIDSRAHPFLPAASNLPKPGITSQNASVGCAYATPRSLPATHRTLLQEFKSEQQGRGAGCPTCCVCTGYINPLKRSAKEGYSQVQDSTDLLHLHRDCGVKPLHAASKKQKSANLEQVKWSKVLRWRQRALYMKDMFRHATFTASFRQIYSQGQTFKATSVPHMCWHPCSCLGPTQKSPQELDSGRHGSSTCVEASGGKRRRLTEAQTPGLRYRSQLDPGVPPHTFAAAMNYIVNRAIDDEAISKKTLELPAKITKLLVVRNESSWHVLYHMTSACVNRWVHIDMIVTLVPVCELRVANVD
jgi:hypothetical protein